MRSYTLEELGDDRSGGGGANERKNGFDVLDRLARLGGLSSEQKSEWRWFKSSWDAKMAEEHDKAWGRLFAEWVNQVLDDIDGGASHAFSVFVHRETRRCFEGQLALRVP